MRTLEYDAASTVEYAHRWCLSYNPNYYNFTDIGGDCTNFASQCLYAGARVMNFSKDDGWFYKTANDRTASWTGVPYLHDFLVSNQGEGPWAEETDISRIVPGDLVQIMTHGTIFHHTPVVVETKKKRPSSLSDIIICAHTFNTDSLPLSYYAIKKVRFMHIAGVRKA